MGVNGLLRLLQPVSIPRQLGHFQGQTLGVDGYAWLHRAAASCAEDLVRNTDTVKLVQSIDKRIRLYESAGVNLYFVFDGAHIDMKSRVSAQRQKSREQAKAAFLSNQTQCVLGGVSITPEHAAMVVAYLKARGIRFVVAPYEADSQLVWLEKNGLVDGILSEDSDLLVFGAGRLLTKADGRTGDCIEVRADRLPSHLDPAGMRALAIVSGCDYSQGVAGLGPVKTSALVKNHAGDLMSICTSLLRSGRIEQVFVAEAKRADLAFQFQRVWDPKTCNIVHLNDPEAGSFNTQLVDAVIGTLLPRPDAHRIARCVVDPNNPKRLLPVSPAVAQFVAKLPPYAHAAPSKYSSKTAVRSMMDRRLPSTPTANTLTSPFFKSSPAIRLQAASEANKENTLIMPTPPASIRASLGPSSLKRPQADFKESEMPLKALRTDTTADVSTPTRRSSKMSSNGDADDMALRFKSTVSPQTSRGPLTATSRTSSFVEADKRDVMRATGTGVANDDEGEPSVLEKIAALQKFAYTKS